jgi:GT2 family glycosyltransferase
VVDRYCVIPTRDRPDDLRDCVAAVAPQVDKVFVVDNLSRPPVMGADHPANVRVICNQDDPPNLSRLWNLGLELAASYANGDPYFVAVLNDDSVVPEGWLDAVVAAMEETGAAAGCSDPSGLLAEPLVHHQPGPVDLRFRLAGFAFVLRGDLGLRADERLAWWEGDTDLDWKARQAGGVVLVPFFPVEHRHPDEQTNARPELAVQAGRDRETFRKLWGGLVPW